MHGFWALPALQHLILLIQIQNLKVRELRLSSPLNARFDVLTGWRVAGLEQCSCIILLCYEKFMSSCS
jgi:hypothetical protein